MTSRLHFELFMQELRTRASAPVPKQPALEGMRSGGGEDDVGSVRLSRIQAAIKEARADRADE